MVLEEIKPYAKSCLVFWEDDEPSQSLEFKTDDECDAVLHDIVNGKGVLVKYDFGKRDHQAFPRRVIKFVVEKEFEVNITPELRNEIEKRQYGLGCNLHQPTLVGANAEEPIETQSGIADAEKARQDIRHIQNIKGAPKGGKIG